MATGRTVIRNGRVIDPSQRLDLEVDVLIADNRIAAIGPSLSAPDAAEIDATGLVVSPGWIDIHVHLREPGFEYKETLKTGTEAAAAGGFTTVCCMPNTNPALDSVEVLRDLNARIAQDAVVRVRPIAAISMGRKGVDPVDYAGVVAEGAIGFSDDGDSCMDGEIMRLALLASKELDRPVMVHCEDRAMIGGAMNLGEVSETLGIGGIPAEAEEVIIARDIALAEMTGGWLHVLHVSTARGIALVQMARDRGVHVTCEVMPHHLLMDDTWVAGNRTLLNVDEPAGKRAKPGDPNTKVNPPLRTAEDARILLEALKGGLFDVVATDHAPHAEEEKGGRPFESAAMGFTAIELALPSMMALVRAGHLELHDVIERFSCVPARFLRQEGGTLAVGSPADVTIFSPDEEWTVSRETLRTKSANTPMLGMTVAGRARYTLVDGEVRYAAEGSWL